jgi:serine/threonine-protein kinase
LAATAFHLLSGSPPFHHSNPTAVISQHLTASPPAISDRRPELSAIDPVLGKALSKDPKDRFNSCMDFARALAHRLGVELVADNERTEASIPVAARSSGGGRHKAHQGPRRRYLRPAIIVPAILAALLLVAIALVLIQFREIEKLLNDDYTPPASSPPPAPSPRVLPPPPSTTTVTASASAAPPVGVVGANCSPIGSTATTANGNTVYCSTLQSTGASIWSVTQGEIPPPTVTVTTEVTDDPLPLEEETPVQVCMQETGKTRRECRDAIRASNEGVN